MNELNMLPIFRQGLNEITDGIDVKVSEFCRKNCACNNKCINYYQDICHSGEGLYTCPFGFNSYVFDLEGDYVIFTGLRVVGRYSKSKVIPKIEDEKKKNREIDDECLHTYIEAYKQFYINQNQYANYEQFVNNIFHDIRKFNMQIKAKNDSIHRLSESNGKYGKFKEASLGIQAICWFLTLRLNSFDFAHNLELMKADIKTTYNIYKIFDKICKCMKEKKEAKYLDIRLDATRNCTDMQAYDSIELLPFILVDNAIKYAPDRTRIDITIEERNETQHATIRSIGPMLSEGEIELIFNRGYRSERARTYTNDGMGIGLFTAKQICDLHGIKIQVKSSDKLYKVIKEVPFSEFSVDFWITL